MLASCLGIIGDICNVYNVKVKTCINQNVCYYLVNKLKGVKKYETLSTWSANVSLNIKFLTIIYIYFSLGHS